MSKNPHRVERPAKTRPGESLTLNRSGKVRAGGKRRGFWDVLG